MGLYRLLSQRLLREPADDEDPLWRLLAELLDRVDEQPGAAFTAPREFRAPDEWSRVFGTEDCVWWVAEHRLRGWHPAGFWPLDVPSAAPNIGTGPASRSMGTSSNGDKAAPILFSAHAADIADALRSVEKYSAP